MRSSNGYFINILPICEMTEMAKRSELSITIYTYLFVFINFPLYNKHFHLRFSIWQTLEIHLDLIRPESLTSQLWVERLKKMWNIKCSGIESVNFQCGFSIASKWVLHLPQFPPLLLLLLLATPVWWPRPILEHKHAHSLADLHGKAFAARTQTCFKRNFC
jgi:hypothetical protein